MIVLNIYPVSRDSNINNNNILQIIIRSHEYLPLLLGLPIPANQDPPRRIIVGTFTNERKLCENKQIVNWGKVI